MDAMASSTNMFQIAPLNLHEISDLQLVQEIVGCTLGYRAFSIPNVDEASM